jgi:hypothetical protein
LDSINKKKKKTLIFTIQLKKKEPIVKKGQTFLFLDLNFLGL